MGGPPFPAVRRCSARGGGGPDLTKSGMSRSRYLPTRPRSSRATSFLGPRESGAYSAATARTASCCDPMVDLFVRDLCTPRDTRYEGADIDFFFLPRDLDVQGLACRGLWRYCRGEGDLRGALLIGVIHRRRPPRLEQECESASEARVIRGEHCGEQAMRECGRHAGRPRSITRITLDPRRYDADHDAACIQPGNRNDHSPRPARRHLALGVVPIGEHMGEENIEHRADGERAMMRSHVALRLVAASARQS